MAKGRGGMCRLRRSVKWGPCQSILPSRFAACRGALHGNRSRRTSGPSPAGYHCAAPGGTHHPGLSSARFLSTLNCRYFLGRGMHSACRSRAIARRAEPYRRAGLEIRCQNAAVGGGLTSTARRTIGLIQRRDEAGMHAPPRATNQKRLMIWYSVSRCAASLPAPSMRRTIFLVDIS